MFDKEMYGRRPGAAVAAGQYFVRQLEQDLAHRRQYFSQAGRQRRLPLDHAVGVEDPVEPQRFECRLPRHDRHPAAGLPTWTASASPLRSSTRRCFWSISPTIAELDVALCRAYNRFIAQACAQSNGRIHWVAIPPLRDIEESVKELQWAKQNGAVGVFFRGMEGNYTLDNPRFYPGLPSTPATSTYRSASTPARARRRSARCSTSNATASGPTRRFRRCTRSAISC